MDFKNMSIDELFRAAKAHPEEFKKQSEQYQVDVIKERCRGDGQCEWRYMGMMRRLNKEADKFKDPVARLNFVMARFWKFINEHY